MPLRTRELPRPRPPAGRRATAGLPAEILDGTPHVIVPAGPGWMFVCAWRTGTQSGGDPTRDNVGSYVVWACTITFARRTIRTQPTR
ncbi:hypothetical protein ACWC6I_10170 [Streptomyces sp. NPDC001414]